MLFIYWTLTTLSWSPKCPQDICPCLGPLSHTSPLAVGMEILRPSTANPHPHSAPLGSVRTLGQHLPVAHRLPTTVTGSWAATDPTGNKKVTGISLHVAHLLLTLLACLRPE